MSIRGPDSTGLWAGYLVHLKAPGCSSVSRLNRPGFFYLVFAKAVCDEVGCIVELSWKRADP